MFRISRLHEIMKGLPRGKFDRPVEAHQADKHAKGFGCELPPVFRLPGGGDHAAKFCPC